MEEKKIEGNIIEAEEESIMPEKIKGGMSINKKRIIIFFIGILIGFIAKGMILKSYVIGFYDYKLKNYKNDFNFIKKTEPTNEKNNAENQEVSPKEETGNTDANNGIEGASCN